MYTCTCVHVTDVHVYTCTHVTGVHVTDVQCACTCTHVHVHVQVCTLENTVLSADFKWLATVGCSTTERVCSGEKREG